MFDHRKPIIGMVHLLPLPGSPLYQGQMEEIIGRAVSEASALSAGGVDGILLENFGDRPFAPGPVGPETVAAMSIVAGQLVDQFDLPIGINVLRCDPISALSIAHAAGALFIRINIHLGARLTDQGILEGMAHQTLRYRRNLGAQNIQIMADVSVKHSQPLADVAPTFEAQEIVERGLADQVIVTGPKTGSTVETDLLQTVRSSVSVPVWAGSGVTPESLESILGQADGVIVGTNLKEHGRVENPVDPMRIRSLTQIRDRLFGPSR